MTYQTEFPDFPPADMPAIPAGFEDSSWHNDASPSIACDALQIRIFIDYVDPEKREIKAGFRFIAFRMDDDGQPDDDALETNEWSDVLAFIETARLIHAGGYHVLTDDSDKRATAYHVMKGNERIHIAYSKLEATDFIESHAKGLKS